MKLLDACDRLIGLQAKTDTGSGFDGAACGSY
jgi:hypothetical protein